MDKKSLAFWEKQRAKGRTHYIVRQSLFWTLWMSAFNIFLMPALNLDQGTYGELVAREFAPQRLVLLLGIMFVCGLCIGAVNWYSYEKQYANRNA